MTALYERVSTDAQAEEGYSIDIQKERLEAYCKVKGYGEFEHYTDGGHTGSNIDRPEIARLIAGCKAGRIERVVVYKLDRLSRSQKDTLYLIEEVFLPHGVDFISVSESFDTSTPFGRAVIGILSVFAQLERENIRERTRAGMLGRVREGYWPGGGRVPFGYDYDASRSILVPNEDAGTVRKIYDLYISGYSTYDIAKLLGLKYERLVSQILTRKSNTGAIVYNGVEYRGRHEPIISSEIYDEAMECMRRRSRQRTPMNNRHLLTGLLKCGVCGAGMRYQKGRIYCYSRQKSKPYLVRDENCSNTSHPADEVERIVLSTLFQNTSRFDGRQPGSVSTDILEELSVQKRNLEQKIRRLYSLYGDSPDEYLLEAVKEAKSKLAQVQRKLGSEEERQKEERARERLMQRVGSLKSAWDSLSGEEKRSLLHEAINCITITQDSINIDFNI